MTTNVEALDVDEESEAVARCRVTTTDATGSERVYEFSIGREELHGRYLTGGKRVDADAPDEPAGGGPSRKAWDAAREHFDERGFEVYENAD